jgi:hypothetical protein
MVRSPFPPIRRVGEFLLAAAALFAAKIALVAALDAALPHHPEAAAPGTAVIALGEGLTLEMDGLPPAACAELRRSGTATCAP